MRLLSEAFKDYGLKEIVGEKHNPRILEFFKVGNNTWVQTDETAWCSAALNYWCYKAGVEYTGKLNAKSWLNLPEVIDTPQLGDICILWRKKEIGPWGHVGIFIREDKDNVYLLGGNQSDQVKISAYPKFRVIGYRRPRNV